MKQLVCEMCGSTDLIKQEGVFVCQSCGCKYSVEEAKKMMVEVAGTVQVQGTVKVDTSNKLKNLYILARRARDYNNISDAAKYYHEIRIDDPNSWEAAFYGDYFTALDCKIGEIESVAYSFAHTVSTVSTLIQDYVPAEQQKSIYTEMILRTVMAGKALYSGAENSLQNSSYEGRSSDFIDRAGACIFIILHAGSVAEQKIEDYCLAENIYQQAKELCQSSYLLHHLIQLPQSRLDNIKSKLTAIQQKKNDEYWKEHVEEKQKYESRIAEIDKEIKEIRLDTQKYDGMISRVKSELSKKHPLEAKLAEIKAEQSKLIDQKSNLGLFAGKQKKLLQERIDSLQSQIVDTEKSLEQAKNETHNNVAARVKEIELERKPLMDKINALNYEKEKIQYELTKDR